MFETLALSIGLGINQPTISSDIFNYESTYGARLKLEHEPSNLYLWGNWDDGTTTILGQDPWESSHSLAGGLGYSIDLNDHWQSFVELGYGTIDTRGPNNGTHNVVEEVAYTYLVGRHNVEDRPVPVEGEFLSGWNIRGGVITRVGLAYDVNKDLELAFLYHYQQVNQDMYIAEPECYADAYQCGYWMENTKLDVSKFEVRVMWKF